jgi:type I restriction enzyme R subunit
MKKVNIELIQRYLDIGEEIERQQREQGWGKSVIEILSKVTFRKPATMAKNVRDAIRLFSNEARDWENLVPREYREVKKEYVVAFKAYQAAQRQLNEDPHDLKKKIEAIKTFQNMKHLGEAIRSYEGYSEEYEEDSTELSAVNEAITAQSGHIENLKAEVKRELEEQSPDGIIPELLEIEFSADQRATYEEIIDSYYISQLLKDINNEDSKRKFDEIIKNKPYIVKMTYDEALGNAFVAEERVLYSVDRHFKRTIEEILLEMADVLKVPIEDLTISFNEYRHDKDEVPYINTIINKSTLGKEEFELAFPGEKFRRKRVVIHEYLQNTFTEKLMPLRGELANFNGEGDVSE